MAQKEITPKQKETLLKFFNTPFGKTGLHKFLTGLIAIIILSLIGTFFYTIWGSTSLGLKFIVTEIAVLVILSAIHWILENAYRNLRNSYIREYPEVWKEHEDGLIKKVKDHHELLREKYKQKIEDSINETKA